MQQSRSCKSETESALRARQRLVRRWYSSWIRFLCSRWEAHGHFIRHWSGPHDTLSFRPSSFSRWSLIHGSTRLCMNSITALTRLTPRRDATTRCVVLCGVGGNYKNQMESLIRYCKILLLLLV
ncbi:hypothetical protein V8G54_010826 [Vigna mungo]|uniref:Uncharacterized protein n=1 Tax=Vigna mungo TaxID=3915 RepID=A0AAQ3S3H5_VIGMU